VSEYQYYEFLAVDRPLDDGQQAELRALSTRADITATSFVNEYYWGNFRGDPSKLMERYFDAFLYVANWGTHQLMIRLPERLLSLDIAQRYCVGDAAGAGPGQPDLALSASCWRLRQHDGPRGWRSRPAWSTPSGPAGSARRLRLGSDGLPRSPPTRRRRGGKCTRSSVPSGQAIMTTPSRSSSTSKPSATRRRSSNASNGSATITGASPV
jgi:hypothetical protein